MPFYNDYMDRDDDNVILIDSSVDSDIDSSIVSPDINDDCVIDILQCDSPLVNAIDKIKQQDLENSSHKYSFKNFLRSLSFRGKSRRDIFAMPEKSDIKAQYNKTDTETNSENSEPTDRSSPASEQSTPSELVAETLNPVVEYSKGSLEQLYDNSKPMEFLLQDNINAPIENRNPAKSNLSLTLVQSNSNISGQDAQYNIESESPTLKNSLSRRFSFFSKRPKSSPVESSKSETTSNQCFDENEVSKDFEYLSLLSKWRFPKYKFPILIPNYKTSDPDLKNKSKDVIYLFLNDLDHENSKHTLQSKKEQNKNIDNFLYYPLTKSLIDNCFAENFDHEKNYRKGLVDSSETKQLSPSSKLENDTYNNKESKTIRRAFNFSNILDVFKANKNNDIYRSDLSAADIKFKQLISSNEIFVLMALQTNKTLANLMTIWNLWVVENDKLKTKKIRGQIFSKIKDNHDISKLQSNYSFLNNYVFQDQKTIYILRENEKPLFHVKTKTKQYGEYVFIIPLKDANLVWNVTTFLVLSEKLINNIPGYHIIGVAWRGFTYKQEFGYHLTLFINDRNEFDINRMGVLLSEFKALIPESLKQHFETCKTLYPGKREATIVDII